MLGVKTVGRRPYIARRPEDRRRRFAYQSLCCRQRLSEHRLSWRTRGAIGPPSRNSRGKHAQKPWREFEASVRGISFFCSPKPT